MNSWEIGYAIMGVITFCIVLIQILILAMGDAKAGKATSTLVIAFVLGSVLAFGLSVIWPVLHLVLLLGVLNGGAKK